MKIGIIKPQSQVFKGNIIVSGKKSDFFKESFFNNPQIDEFRQLKDDFEIKIVSREASKDEVYIEGRDEVLYKVFIKKLNDGNSFLGRLYNFMRGKGKELTKNYHSESTTSAILSSRLTTEHLNNLGLK